MSFRGDDGYQYSNVCKTLVSLNYVGGSLSLSLLVIYCICQSHLKCLSIMIPKYLTDSFSRICLLSPIFEKYTSNLRRSLYRVLPKYLYISSIRTPRRQVHRKYSSSSLWSYELLLAYSSRYKN